MSGKRRKALRKRIWVQCAVIMLEHVIQKQNGFVETMLAAYEAQYHIPYVGVRLCHTFGPGISLEDGRAFSRIYT